jgi:hypothetical protein
MSIKFRFFLAVLFFSLYTANAQNLKSLIIQSATQTSSVINQIPKSSQLSNTDIVNGLKEALTLGAQKSASKLSAVDGFFKDAALKILLPPEAQKITDVVSKIPGGNKLIDDAILSMNRAAEDAAKSAAPIFINAIKNMSINDAIGILKGPDTAATHYLKSNTINPLTTEFKIIIEQSLAKVNATQYWNSLMSAYNKIPFNKKINPDLSAYVTEKAISGIFTQIAVEEQKIRKDPTAQVTNTLKKVFRK